MLIDESHVHVVCGTDDNYAPHLAALLTSIHENKGNEVIHIHAILDEVSQESLKRIEKLGLDLTLHWYPVGDHEALSLPPLLHISRATYLRLIVDKLVPQALGRILYLDIDMIVTTSLKSLWDTDLKGNWCAAVTDPGIDIDEFADRFSLSGKSDYFNAGLILFDLNVVREKGLFQTALKTLQSDPEKFSFADQDALNIVYWRNWLAVDPSWNFQRKFLMKEFPFPSAYIQTESNPRVIHYTQALKPWKPDEWHPYRWLYQKYLLKTDFASGVFSGAGITKINLLRSYISYRKFILKSGLKKCALKH